MRYRLLAPAIVALTAAGMICTAWLGLGCDARSGRDGLTEEQVQGLRARAHQLDHERGLAQQRIEGIEAAAKGTDREKWPPEAIAALKEDPLLRELRKQLRNLLDLLEVLRIKIDGHEAYREISERIEAIRKGITEREAVIAAGIARDIREPAKSRLAEIEAESRAIEAKLGGH